MTTIPVFFLVFNLFKMTYKENKMFNEVVKRRCKMEPCL